ncbi:AraC family transcriptional regulator [Clostridium swellfunianum]|uniref:AraC family transcriptional regulator n=1 Tax=Clostridium swellfunianum TaxID=1367462 RepID=UPI00202E5130|nr:AraC family transcriptional regulator [Clostridium swellfunianum]MCM0647199.1 AraC family transcriptional regulator [Clostridium swellfunianum]
MVDYIQLIQNSIDYIEENLKEELSVDKLSELTGFSSYHYYRLFNAYVGMPVMQYVRRRRMLHGISDVVNKGKKIIDVAMQYGFNTHSGFSKAFNKEYGCSPSQYIENINGSIPKKIDLMVLKKYNLLKGIVMEPKITTKLSFRIAGYEFETSFESQRNEREIPAFWERFEIENWEDKLYEEVKPSVHGEYAVCFPPNMETGKFQYLLGVTAEAYDRPSENIIITEIPEALYAVFTTPPAPYENREFSKAIQGTWNYIMYEWFPNSGYEIAPGKPDFEYYDERCHNPLSSVMDIYIPIVKKQ